MPKSNKPTRQSDISKDKQLSFDLTGKASAPKDSVKDVVKESSFSNRQFAPSNNIPEDESETLKKITDKDYDKVDENLQNKQSLQLEKIKETFDPTKLYNNYDKNLVKQDPRGALNNRTFNESLALARMVDRYNNHLWSTPTSTGSRYVTKSGVSGTPTNVITEQAKPHYANPLETEETRQMQMNRRLDESRKNQEVNLQAGLQQYDFDLQKMADKDKMSLLQFYSQLDKQTVNQLKTATVNMFTAQGMEYIQEQNMLYQSMLDLDKRQLAANAVYNTLFNGNEIYSDMLGQQFGVITPTMDQRLKIMLSNDYFNEAKKLGLDTTTTLAGYYQLMGIAAHDSIYGTFQGLTN